MTRRVLMGQSNKEGLRRLKVKVKKTIGLVGKE